MQNVKVTPPTGAQGGRATEIPRRSSRARSVRIRYGARQSATGAGNPKLRDLRVIVLGHAHGDRIGNRRCSGMGDCKMKAEDADTCAAPESESAAPDSMAAEIAAAKDSAVVTMIPMTSFIGNKTENVKVKLTGVREITRNVSGSDLVVRLPTAASQEIDASGVAANVRVPPPHRGHFGVSRRAAKLAARPVHPPQSRCEAIGETSRAWANPPSSADRRARTCAAPAP